MNENRHAQNFEALLVRLTKRNLKFIIPMKKALEVAKEISKEFSQSVNEEVVKSVICDSIGNETCDKFSIISRSKAMSIQASNPRSAAYAISQLNTYVKGKQPHEILADNQPLYPLRPLWIHCDKHVALTENVGCYLPSFFLGKKKKNFEKFCQRVLELGFNAVILGSRKELFERKSTTVFKEICVLNELFTDYGIQMIVKPVVYHPPGNQELALTPTDKQFSVRVSQAIEDLQRVFSTVQYIVWESVYCDQDFHYHPSGRGYSKFEKTVMELRLVEGVLSDGVSLLYYLPALNKNMAEKQALWFRRLLNEAGRKTKIAFSCVAGSPYSDHISSHPFWEVLQQTDRPPSTPVLPIINSGGVKLGEGYWPNFPHDLFEEYLLPHEVKYPVAGYIHTIRTIPNKGTLADASAWVAGMSMWRKRQPMKVLEAWYRSHFPDGQFDKFFRLLKKSRLVILELSALLSVEPSEMLKCRFESTLSLLKEVESEIENSNTLSKKAMKEMFQVFIRDARRVVLYFSHIYEISIATSTGEDFKGEGVWTKLTSGGVGEGAVSSGKVSIYDDPQIGDEGTASYLIHHEISV